MIVKEVLANWRTPQGKHYRVITQDEGVFDCWYSEVDDKWNVEEIYISFRTPPIINP